MDLTDQGAQMEPLLPTVRPDSRAAVAFTCTCISSDHICTDVKELRRIALCNFFLFRTRRFGEKRPVSALPWISRQTWMLRTLNWQTDPVAANISPSSSCGALCALK